jgi:hypothetical protein
VLCKWFLLAVTQDIGFQDFLQNLLASITKLRCLAIEFENFCKNWGSNDEANGYLTQY